MNIIEKILSPQVVFSALSLLLTVIMSTALSVEPFWFMVVTFITSVILLFVFKPEFATFFLVILMNATYLVVKTDINTVKGLVFLLPDYFLLLAPLLLLLSLIFGKANRYTGTSVDLPLLAFLFLASLSLLWSHDYSVGKFQLFKLIIAVFSSFVVLVSTLTSERSVRKLLWLLFVIGVINASICFFAVYTYPEYTGANILDMGSVFQLDLQFVDKYEVKSRGHALGHPLTTATWLVNSIFMSIALFLTTPSKKGRLFIGIMIAFMLAALMTTMSKGPLIALFGAITFMFYLIKPLRGWIFASMSVLVVTMIAAFIIGNSSNINFVMKFTGNQISTNDSYTSTSSRLVWWKEAIGKTFDTNGIGVGIGGLKQYLTRSPEHPHNVYVSALGELGILGFSLLVMIYLVSYVSYWRALQGCKNEYFRRLLLVYLSGYVAILMSIFVNLGYVISSTWWYLGLGFALVKIAQNVPPDFHEELLPYHEKGKTMVADTF